MRNPEIQKRWEFPVSIVLGLAKAVTDDEDVCLLALSAITPKKTSRAIQMYVVFRRMDSYMTMATHLMSRVAITLEKVAYPPVKSNA